MSDESKGCFIVVLVLMFIIAPLMNMCDGGSSSSTSNSEYSKRDKAEKILKSQLTKQRHDKNHTLTSKI